MRTVVLVLLSCLLGFSSFACAEGSESEMKAPDGFLIPKGDVKRGEKAFMDLQCFRCHTVGERFTNQPTFETDGPAFGHTQAHYMPGWIMSSIVSPSHYVKLDRYVPPSQTLIEGSMVPAEKVESAMYDFTETMTVRQLIDLVEYIQSLDQY
jgi:sulfur-oxidizing protein SoxX